MLFKKPKNLLEGHMKLQKTMSTGVTELTITCPVCKKISGGGELAENQHICPYCRHHFRINARQRLHLICDEGSFTEADKDITSVNILEFPEYENKLKIAALDSAEKEGVVCGTCKIGGYKTCIFVMEPYFMMGSMGSAVGEKLTRLFERATKENLPVVGFTVSGGARMQEGVLSLMQMAKVTGAVKYHSDAGLLFVCVLTDPTTGGVTASFAMEGDVNIAEPGALIGFAGPRVIEQTIRKKLPSGFQTAKFLLEKGFLDDIVDRKHQKAYLVTLLKLHQKEGRR